MVKSDMRFAFFGTPRLAVIALEELAESGYLPSLVVTGPDKPQGRGLMLQAPPAKDWALAHGIPCLQPEKIDDAFLESLGSESWDAFVLVAYGKILPQRLLDIPKRGVLNVHPSLLPKYRGPSPAVSGVLADDRATGVTVMQIDAKMDHGPIVAQRAIAAESWPPRAEAFEEMLVRSGAALLADCLHSWIKGELKGHAQEESRASYCAKIRKEDGLLNLSDDPYRNMLKIRAYEGWPGTFAFFEQGGKKIRVKILDARLEDGMLAIERVVPEGKKEMDYSDFLRTGASPIA